MLCTLQVRRLRECTALLETRVQALLETRVQARFVVSSIITIQPYSISVTPMSSALFHISLQLTDGLQKYKVNVEGIACPLRSRRSSPSGDRGSIQISILHFGSCPTVSGEMFHKISHCQVIVYLSDWCLMPSSRIFHLYHGAQHYGRGEIKQCPVETHNHPQVAVGPSHVWPRPKPSLSSQLTANRTG